MKTQFFFWLVTTFAFLMLEVGHPGLFFFLSFALGALVSAAVSIWYDSEIIQGAVFLASTIVWLLVLKYWNRHAQTGDDNHTNVYALRGKRGVVTVPIMTGHAGQVRIHGEVWSARSAHGEDILAGVVIEVVDMRGNHVVVQAVGE